MIGDYIPLAIGLLVFLASIISLRVGLSVAIIEIFLGAIAGNLGLKAEEDHGQIIKYVTGIKNTLHKVLLIIHKRKAAYKVTRASADGISGPPDNVK